MLESILLYWCWSPLEARQTFEPEIEVIVNIARLDSVSTLFALDTALQFAASIPSFNAALTFVVEISQYANKVFFFDNMQIWDAAHRILRRKVHLGAILD